jgi:hypothetical protein
VKKAYEALDRARLQVQYAERDRDEFVKTMEMQEQIEKWATEHGLEIEYPGEPTPEQEAGAGEE